MPNRVNLVSHWGDNDNPTASQSLEVVKLGISEIAAVPFNSDAEIVNLHYLDSPELRGFVHCNGPKCVLCRAGRKPEQRLLLPVYLPAGRVVGVLPISPSIRVGALRPQVMPVIKSGRRAVMFISKADNVKFVVTTRDLGDDMDDGAAAIKSFMPRWEAGEVKLADVFQQVDNRTLAGLPDIGGILKMKGINLDADGNPQ
jgi:hypothetical protein